MEIPALSRDGGLIAGSLTDSLDDLERVVRLSRDGGLIAPPLTAETIGATLQYLHALNAGAGPKATLPDRSQPVGVVVCICLVLVLLGLSAAMFAWKLESGAPLMGGRPGPPTPAAPAPTAAAAVPTAAAAAPAPPSLIPLSYRVSLSPGDRQGAQRLNAQGYRAYKQGPRQYKAARQSYEQAVKRDPSFALAWYNLACMDGLAGDMDGAMGALRNVSRLDTSNLSLRIQRDEDFATLRGNPAFSAWVKHSGWLAQPRDCVDVSHRVEHVTASSAKPDWADYTFNTSNLTDLNLATSWQPSGTVGTGEWFEVTLAPPTLVAGIELANGLQARDTLGDQFVLNNRVDAAEIAFEDHTRVIVSLPATQRGWTRFEWEPRKTSSLRFTVLSVHRGNRWNDLAISEVRVLGLNR